MSIERSLREFLNNRAEAQVIVAMGLGVNEWARVHALVASHGFEGRSLHELRDMIWDHLEETVPPTELAYLYGIDILTRREFDVRCSVHEFPGGVTTIVRVNSPSQDAVNE